MPGNWKAVPDDGTGTFMQSRRHSLLESVIKAVVGAFMGLFTQLVVFPWYGIKIEFWQNITMVLIFTFVSVVYSYVVRRVFNWLHYRNIL